MADAVGRAHAAACRVVADTTAMVEQLAQAEGLTLIPSSNICGFMGVTSFGKRNYNARWAGINLGSFPSAAEAALAYARHLGPARCAEVAARSAEAAGVSSSAADLGKRRRNELTAVESVVAVEADDEEEEDGEALTRATVHTVMTEPEHAGSSITSTSGPTFKRRRTARTDEYAFTMPPSTRELTVPVPEGAVRAVCSITFHFA